MMQSAHHLRRSEPIGLSQLRSALNVRLSPCREPTRTYTPRSAASPSRAATTTPHNQTKAHAMEQPAALKAKMAAERSRRLKELHRALRRRDYIKARRLLSSDAALMTLQYQASGGSLLEAVAAEGDVAMVWLYNTVLDDRTMPEGSTLGPFIAAIEADQHELVRFMLRDLGWRVHNLCIGRLISAVLENGSLDLLQALEAAHSNREGWRTTAMCVSSLNYPGMLDRLLELGWARAVTCQDAQYTILCAASLQHHMLVRLLDDGFDASLALLASALKGSAEGAKLCLERGADLTTRNAKGQTPAEAAAAAGHGGLARFLGNPNPTGPSKSKKRKARRKAHVAGAADAADEHTKEEEEEEEDKKANEGVGMVAAGIPGLTLLDEALAVGTAEMPAGLIPVSVAGSRGVFGMEELPHCVREGQSGGDRQSMGLSAEEEIPHSDSAEAEGQLRAARGGDTQTLQIEKICDLLYHRQFELLHMQPSPSSCTTAIATPTSPRPAAPDNAESLVEDLESYLVDDAPDEYLCPVSMVLMTDPVVAPDGRTYQREALQRCIDFARQKSVQLRSPITGLQMEQVFLPSLTIKALVREYIETKIEQRM